MDIIRDSLDLIGNTPLLLVKNLDTGPCNLYLKLESFNLGGSIKDRPAKNMIIEAEKKGLIEKQGKNKKTIKINGKLNIQVAPCVLLDFKILGQHK